MVNNRSSMLFIGFVLLMALVLRCWNINQSFWWDEIWSTMAYVKSNSLWDVVSSLGYYFNNHIFYSLLARGSIKILGESEFAARLPALIMGLLAIIMLFYFGRRFLNEPAGIVASFLLALSAFHIDHSSEARGYSGLALFAILSSWYFLEVIKTNKIKSWVCYVLFSVLGFYSHVFMLAVSSVQFFSAVVFIFGEKLSFWKIDRHPHAFRNFLIALGCTGAIATLIYSPVLSTFFTNMGKVRLVQVDRMPFILSLLNSFFPGVQSFLGGGVYTLLFFIGIYRAFKNDHSLCIYIVVLSVLPLSLYLLMNPMFVFERYFVFALPFVLLIVGQGIVGLADNFKGAYKNGVVIIFLFLLVYLQYPALATMLNQDRQNYREAVRYVENERGDRKSNLIFTIGYAGDHFRYYARNMTIHTPETLAELSALTEGKEHIWCLVTAWLPDIRPRYEERDLYAERSGQTEIYDYVKNNFKPIRRFPSRYPVEVYLLETQKKR